MHPLDLTKVGLTNESYSTEQEALIRRALTAAEQQLLNAEMIAKQITRYRVALAPHKKLSEDVLRHIFTLVCSDDSDVAVLDPGTANTWAAVKLSHVCSAWRRLALKMPHLWIQIKLEMQHSHRADIINDNDRKIQLAEMWLARGGCLPRTLFFSDSHNRTCDPIEKLVFPYSYRILHLWLYNRDLESLRDIEPKHMVPLEYLTIRWTNRQHWHCQFLLPLPAKMPNLSRLCLDSCIEVNLDKLVTGVPWHQLTRIELSFPVPSVTCFNVILRQAMSLKHCILYPAMDSRFVIDTNAEPIILPRMMIMILHCTSTTDAQLFDRWVETPNARCRDIT
ncbi:hypothetical protein F5887DRAFT_985464, partial [Amanita rubescens]